MLAVLLALGASIFWGLGDLIAGLTARRGPALSVTVVSQVAGATGATAVILTLGRSWPGWPALFPAVLGGLALSVSAVSYFKALAIGKMSIVGPIGTSGAVVPVIAGMVQGERPGALQILGTVAAIIGMIMASRESREAKVPVTPGEMLPPEEHDGRRSPSPEANRKSILLAAASALTYGLLMIGLARSARFDPYWPPLVTRGVSVVILSPVVVGSMRRGLGLSGRAFVVALLAGVCHVTAVTLFSLSTTRGLLSIVAVLSSLSAVVVVVVAWLALHERLMRVQQVGVVLTLAGVLAIVGG